ncbi:MAG TPA: peptidase domain-containing ABC transporter [Gammaproteobacteria bacterium]|nr:peptidase domain-containing ABC transporter [Gammaproteobacteria bacterium]
MLRLSGRRLPVLLQTEAAECGLACLAMVSSYHGYRTDVGELRRRHSLSLKGATLAHLITIASSLGFTSRPLRLELDELRQLKCPAILHWDLNHFVVFKAVRGNKAVIHDPARGRKTLTLDEVSRHFTGVALELAPSHGFQRKAAPPIPAIWSLLGSWQGMLGVFTQILIFSLALEAFAILSPFFTQLIVDQVLVNEDQGLLTVLGIGFGLLAIINVAVGAFRGWVVAYLGSHVSFHSAGALMRHLVGLPLDFFSKRHVGDVVSRFNSLNTIQQTLTSGLIETMVDGVMVVFTLGVMLFYSIPLTLLVLGLIAGYGLLRFAAYRPLHTATEEQIVQTAKQQTNFLETVRGMQSIKVAGCELERHTQYQNLLADTINTTFTVSKLNIAFTTANGLLFGLGTIAVIWWGASEVMAGALSIGMLLAFISYASQSTGKAGALIEKGIAFRMLRLHAERVGDIVFTEPEVSAPLPRLGDTPIQGRIEIENLAYRYGDLEPHVLKDVRCCIEPGESVAIIGPSGCGKTTLVKLLLGLMRPTEGFIRIDGLDIQSLGLQEYRRHVGAVMQDDQLFAGTLADNISFFDPQADQAWIETCAKLAAIHDDILAMPMAYNTLIGDMGTVLSGGQKQRVVLARAVYRRPRILFLDEATSHLDVNRERLVNNAISQLNITRIIIAHRHETISSADRIIRLGTKDLEVFTSADKVSLRISP